MSKDSLVDKLMGRAPYVYKDDFIYLMKCEGCKTVSPFYGSEINRGDILCACRWDKYGQNAGSLSHWQRVDDGRQG